MHRTGKIRLLIADPFPVIRWGIRDYFNKQTNYEVVGEAATIRELEELANSQSSDVAILDLSIPDGDPIHTIKHLTRNCGLLVVGFSSSHAAGMLKEFFASGGRACVSKNSPLSELHTAIDAVANKHTYICPEMKKTACGNSSVSSHCADLSAREREVAVLVARGLTSRQIANQLCVSLKTVETHRYRIFKHLRIASRAELVDYVIRNGLLVKTGIHV